MEDEDAASPPKDSDSMMDYLISSGVDPVVAKHRLNAMTAPKPTATFMEVYGRGAIVECANRARRDLNIEGLDAMDLRTNKEDGTPWDFSQRNDRRLARRLVEERKPDWIIGSPPCTSFSIWNYAMNYPKMDPAKVQAAVDEGRTHLNFMTSLYRLQVRAGRFFLHEHPATALSWKEEKIMDLLEHPDVDEVVADQCQYGLTSKSPEGDELPVLKPTRFMSNSRQMLERLSRRCKRDHVHQQLTGGRCAAAAFYPLKLVKSILLAWEIPRS